MQRAVLALEEAIITPAGWRQLLAGRLWAPRRAAGVGGAIDVALTALDAAALARLEEIAPVQGGFPRSFLTGETVRRLIFGETFTALDNHRDPFA
jgi:hypothetical protein